MTNIISVRSPDPCLRILRKAVVKPSSPRSLEQRRFVILIHGFQNNESKARESYAKFRNVLSSVFWPLSIDTIGSFWEYHWPGDHPKPLVSAATYSVRVPDAENAGRLLYEFLRGCSIPREVILIGHSLGCRVALEAMRYIRDDDTYTGPTISTAILLAAAVSVEMCNVGKIFDWDLSKSEEYVFWSKKDGALGKIFNAGQYLCNEPGMAVGRHGLPSGRWTRRIRTELDHGDYWGSLDNAQIIARIFGRHGDRTLPRLPPDFGRSLIARELVQRDIATRLRQNRNSRS